MKVKIERECCESEDLKPYLGLKEKKFKYQFCQYCGQVWSPEKTVMDLPTRKKVILTHTIKNK